jgi:hypothetical protein
MRLRDKEPVHVSTRSPCPTIGKCFAPASQATAGRVISAMRAWSARPPGLFEPAPAAIRGDRDYILESATQSAPITSVEV